MDFKICTKALANRLKGVLLKLISPNQTGFLKGRFIGENVRFVLDLVDFYHETQQPGLMFMVDFEKAFDRIERDFIYKALDFFGFGDSFKRWISVLYAENAGRVINNGHSCPEFPITRGVKQGCPLSPYIFLLCAEVLTLLTNDNNDIKGISLFGNTIQSLFYADDTVVFSDGSYASLSATVSAFRLFEQSSGLRVNFGKSYLFPRSSLTEYNCNYRDLFGLNLTSGPVTLLGITFTNNRDDLYKLNYIPKLSRLKNKLNIWSQRDLSLLGKITIVKSLGLSQLVYLFQILPNPPDYFIKELNTVIFRFVWNNKLDKIKRKTLCAPISEGGLRAPHIPSFIQSLKCSWVKDI